ALPAAAGKELFGEVWRACLEAPLKNSFSRTSLPTSRSSAPMRASYSVSTLAAAVSLSSGLVLGNPDPDQVAADVMPLGEPVKRLAGQVVLNNLPLELDRVAAVLGHGAFSSKARPR